MSPPFKPSHPAENQVTAVTVELSPVTAEHSPEERALLLQIARLAIEKTLGGEMVEMAARGSGCRCPQCGQATRTRSWRGSS